MLRIGVVIRMRPGMTYYLRHVGNKREGDSNSVTQYLGIEFCEFIRLTRAYLSRKVSGDITV